MRPDPSGPPVPASSFAFHGCLLAEDPGRGPVSVTGDERTIVVRPGGGRVETASDEPARFELEVPGALLAPGLVDLQCNGGYGIDLTTDPAGIWDLGARLPRHGVVAFLPTLVSPSDRTVAEALHALRHRPVGYRGAEPLGLHLEGPFLNPRRRGAHPPDRLTVPGDRRVDRWTRADGVRLVTLAPELAGATDLIGRLVERGVAVWIGHTEASTAETLSAVDAGASGVTHLFNAMPGLGHREPGPVGVALADDRLLASLIVDGVHLDPSVVRIAFSLLGPDRLVLVSDGTAASGSDRTTGGLQLAGAGLRRDGRALRTEDGALAGSACTLDDAVRILRRTTGCEPWEAVRCASVTPRRALGMVAPSVDAGSLGDLVLLSRDLDVVATVVSGQLVHVAPLPD